MTRDDFYRHLASEIEQSLGVRVISYDPGLTVVSKEADHLSCEIPTWLALRISKALRAKDEPAQTA